MGLNNLKYLFQFSIKIQIQKPLNHPPTLVKVFTGYAQDVTLTDPQTTELCINELTDFKHAYAVNYITHTAKRKIFYFPNIKTLIAMLTQNCLNCQTSKYMPKLLLAPRQQLLEVQTNFIH